MAGEMMIGYLLQAKDRFSATFEKLDANMSKTSKKAERLNARMKSFSDVSRKVGKGIMLGVVAPVLALGVAAYHVSGQFRDMEDSLLAVTGNAKDASVLFEQFKKISRDTGSSLASLVDVGTQIGALGYKGKGLVGMVNELNVASTALSQPIQALPMYLSQIKIGGKVGKAQLTTMKAVGVSVGKEMYKMAAQLGISHKKFQENLNHSKVSSKFFMQALHNLTTKGGTLYTAFQKKNVDLVSEVSSLGNNIQQFVATLGNATLGTGSLGGALGKLDAKLSSLQQPFETFLKVHPEIVKVTLSVIGLVAAVGVLAIAVSALGVLFNTLFAPITAIVLAVVAIIYAFYKLYEIITKSKTAMMVINRIATVFKNLWKETVVDFNKILPVLKFIGKVFLDLGEIIYKGFVNDIKISIDVFKTIYHIIKDIVSVVKIMMHPFSSLISGVKMIGALFDKSKGGVNVNHAMPGYNAGMSNLGAASSINSKHDVTVTLVDPGKSVKNVSVKSNGKNHSNFNLGTNMPNVLLQGGY